jgi:hypothetical protein
MVWIGGVMLTRKEREFLLIVRERQGGQDPVRPKQADPLLPHFQTLVDRGYMRVSRLMCALFQQPTGEVCFLVTEAGSIILDHFEYIAAKTKPDDAPADARGIDV